MRAAAFFALGASLLASSAGGAPATGTRELGRAVPVPGGHGTAASVELEFSRLNRAYRDVAGALAPTQAGPLRLELSSPRQEVTLQRHRLRLAPRGDGTHDASLWTSFRGRGLLDAQASVLGLGRTFRDEVTLPDQTHVLRARLRLARGQGGYLVTTLALPPEAEVQVRSRLGGQLVGWCEGLLVLPCGGLDDALRTAAVPLPPPGRTYLLADADLTADDRRRLDEYLGGRKRP